MNDIAPDSGSATLHCPVCGAPFRSAGALRLGKAGIHTCASCGSGVLLPRPSQEDLSGLHSTDEYFDHPYFQVRRELTPKLAASYAERLAKIERLDATLAGKRLLDIGCDTGLFLQFMQERRGMSGVGIDVFSRVVEQGRRAGLDLRRGTLEELRFDDDSFDVVCGFDLIEHVSDPIGFVREVRRVLRPGGAAIFETPNYDGLVYRLGRALGRVRPLETVLRPYQQRLWPLFHVQYFTGKSIEMLLRKGGFGRIETTGRELAGSELAIESGLLRAAVIGLFRLAGASGSNTILTATAVNPQTEH